MRNDLFIATKTSGWSHTLILCYIPAYNIHKRVWGRMLGWKFYNFLIWQHWEKFLFRSTWKWTTFCCSELQFLAQMRNNKCTISSPMCISVFTVEPKIVVPSCRMKSKYVVTEISHWNSQKSLCSKQGSYYIKETSGHCKKIFGWLITRNPDRAYLTGTISWM